MECLPAAQSKAIQTLTSQPAQLETVPVETTLSVPVNGRSEYRSRTIAARNTLRAGNTLEGIRSRTTALRGIMRGNTYLTRNELERCYARLEGYHVKKRNEVRTHSLSIPRYYPCDYSAHVDAMVEFRFPERTRCYSMREYLSPAPHIILDELGQLVDIVPGKEESARAYRSAWQLFKRYGHQLSIQDIASRDCIAETVHDATLVHLSTGMPFRIALQRSALRVIRRDGKFKVESNTAKGIETLEKALQSARTIASEYGELHRDFLPALQELRHASQNRGKRMSAKEQSREYRAKVKLARQLGAHSIGNDEIYRTQEERRILGRKEVSQLVKELTPEAQAIYATLGKAKRDILARILHATKIRGRASSGSNKRYAGIHEERLDAIGNYLRGQGILIREDKYGRNYAYRADRAFRRAPANHAQGITKVFLPEFRPDWRVDTKATAEALPMTHKERCVIASPVVPQYVPMGECEATYAHLYGESYNRPKWSYTERPLIPYAEMAMADCDGI